MNKRLLAYLRSIGLAHDASEDVAWEFFHALRGVQANIANALNYDEADSAARANCDVMIRSLGYTPENPSQESPQQTPGSDGASANGELEAALAEGAQRERARVQAIREYATIAGSPQDLVDTLVGDIAITADAARQRIFADHQARTRAQVNPDRPNPAIHGRNSQTGYTADQLAGAMLHRCGLDPSRTFVRANAEGSMRLAPEAERTRIAEESWQYAHLPLRDVVRMALRIDGIDVSESTSVGEMLQRFWARSGFSTLTLSSVFTTNVSAQLLTAFQQAPDSTTGGWVREADVPNFLTNERARMEKGPDLKRLPRGKEADHAEFEDNVETYKIARYARQFCIDEQDIIDDRFGGIGSHVLSEFGQAAARLRPDLVYYILMSNPNMRDSVALFHLTHSNLNTTAAFTLPNLTSARAKMMLQRENSINLNLMLAFLIVPPALEISAKELSSSPLVITGSDVVRAANNVIAGEGIKVVTDARLENGVTDPVSGATSSGSATTWFGAAAASAHTIEVGYLAGTGRAPQVRMQPLPVGRWGFGWDIKMDIGAKALSWEGLCKNTA